MKDAEDEAFDDLERKQGGFQAKRAMAADKLQEFCTCHETHPMECQGCRANRLAQPAQEQWNAALDEAASRIAEIKGFGQATQDSFAVYIKGLKK